MRKQLIPLLILAGAAFVGYQVWKSQQQAAADADAAGGSTFEDFFKGLFGAADAPAPAPAPAPATPTDNGT